MKKFLITEVEKARILGMHYNAMGKSLVSEQDIPWTTEIIDKTGIRSIGSMESEYMDMGQFEVTFNTTSGGGTLYAYQCITDPRKKEGAGGFKGGTLRDYNAEKIVNPNEVGLKGDWLNYVKQYCKPGYDWLAKWNAKNAPKTQPAPQVAAATTKVNAPNPVSDQSVADDQKRTEEAKASTAKLKTELTTKLADPNFLNPNKYDTDKSGLDADAKRASLFTVVQGVATGDEAMDLKRKINNLIKAKPEYKAEPFGLNINF
jgi:hypothetical protein